MEKPGYVYILASGFKHLYIGVTSNLERRMLQHQQGTYASAFTEPYNIKHLVHFERWASMSTAIPREKQLKRWSRVKKVRLIVGTNPAWHDLSLEWGTAIAPLPAYKTGHASEKARQETHPQPPTPDETALPQTCHLDRSLTAVS